jgi:bacterioferritin
MADNGGKCDMATGTATGQRQQIIEMLEQAYVMEMETVTNYLAHSVNLDGVRAEEIKGALAKDVMEELGHAQRLANRIKQVGGRVPGSLQLTFDQQSLQPGEDTTNVKAVIVGVLEAENAAIDHYRRIIRETDGEDFVTQDLMIQLLGDEEKHRVQFEGYLAEYERS